MLDTQPWPVHRFSYAGTPEEVTDHRSEIEFKAPPVCGCTARSATHDGKNALRTRNPFKDNKCSLDSETFLADKLGR